jgi:hypothetical protein
MRRTIRTILPAFVPTRDALLARAIFAALFESLVSVLKIFMYCMSKISDTVAIRSSQKKHEPVKHPESVQKPAESFELSASSDLSNFINMLNKPWKNRLKNYSKSKNLKKNNKLLKS